MRKIVRYSDKFGKEKFANEFYDLSALAGNIVQKIDNFNTFFMIEFPYVISKNIVVVNDIDHMLRKVFNDSPNTLKQLYDKDIVTVTSYTNKDNVEGSIELWRTNIAISHASSIPSVLYSLFALHSVFHWRDNNYDMN